MTGANLKGGPDKLTFLLQLDEPVDYKAFTLDSPDRVVIDLINTTMSGKLKQGAHDRPPLTGIRYAVRDDGRLRVVLDMKEQVSVKASMQAEGSSNVLAVTMTPTGKGSSKDDAPSEQPEKPEQPEAAEPPKKKTSAKQETSR